MKKDILPTAELIFNTSSRILGLFGDGVEPVITIYPTELDQLNMTTDEFVDQVRLLAQQTDCVTLDNLKILTSADGTVKSISFTCHLPGYVSFYKESVADTKQAISYDKRTCVLQVGDFSIKINNQPMPTHQSFLCEYLLATEDLTDAEYSCADLAQQPFFINREMEDQDISAACNVVNKIIDKETGEKITDFFLCSVGGGIKINPEYLS